MGQQTIWASFVGIDAYAQNALSGCVADVLQFDALLRGHVLAQQASLCYQPFYLLAPNAAGRLRLAAYEKAEGLSLSFEEPTFTNVSQKTFAHLKQAQAGDVCVFFYSGHGSQADAPEVFWHSKPDRQAETLVCVDSRDPAQPQARDLLDKELAFLLWDALHDEAGAARDVHCLVVMDCCHSGNNTRAAAEDNGLRFRYEIPSGKKIPLEQYIGYEKNFYKIENGIVNIPVARYVHLAAARDNEKAQETISGGLFTSKLMEVLHAAGTGQSYRHLMQSAAISVALQASQQHPVAFAATDSDLDLRFLGGGVVPHQPSFVVLYDVVQEQWLLHAGALHGLRPAVDAEYTTVRILGVDCVAKLKMVSGLTSVLDETDLAALDPEKEYRAAVVHIAAPVLKLGLAPALQADTAKKEALVQAYDVVRPVYYHINFNDADAASDYWVQLTQDAAYALTKRGSHVPLFKRSDEANGFLKNLDAVGNWINTVNLNGNASFFSKEDFVFTLERIAGKMLPAVDADSVAGEVIDGFDPEQGITAAYTNGCAPAFRLRLAMRPGAALRECYVGALYLDSRFGIDHNLLQEDASRLLNSPDSVLHLGSYPNGRFRKTIELEIDAAYFKYGVNEITDYLKIFVSTTPLLDLDAYDQANLALDDNPEVGMRSVKPSRRRSGNSAAGWMAFTIPIQITGPHNEKDLKPGTVTFPLFTVDVPQGFAARAVAATAADLDTNRVARGVATSPAGIWGDTLTADEVFQNPISGIGADTAVQSLVLTPLDEYGDLKIIPGTALVLKPAQPKTAMRALMDANDDETILSYGFDAGSGLFFPVGTADDGGAIHITHLPLPAAADSPAGVQARSVGGAVNLYFKKIFKPKDVSQLKLYRIEPNGAWTFVTNDPAAMNGPMTGAPEASVLLLVHGIMGDTRYPVAALQHLEGIAEKVRFMLTYDYETLATPVAKAAADLKNTLLAAGLDNEVKRITIVAHSTGGLVARWLVEKVKDVRCIKHLILIATPSAGTALSKLSASAFALLTHALNVTGPIKYAITGLAFLIKKLQFDPTHVLQDVQPGSALLQDLSTSRQPEGVTYSVISGDAALLQAYEGDDYFFKKLAAVLAKNIIHPGLRHLFNNKPNDLAVTVDSAQALPGFAAAVHIIASDHLSYFHEKETLAKIAALL